MRRKYLFDHRLDRGCWSGVWLELALGFGGQFVGPGIAFEAINVAEHVAAWTEELFLEQRIDVGTANQPPAFERGCRMVGRDIRRLSALDITDRAEDVLGMVAQKGISVRLARSASTPWM